MAGLMHEAENLNEEDPRQVAQLMRKFADKTGTQPGWRHGGSHRADGGGGGP